MPWSLIGGYFRGTCWPCCYGRRRQVHLNSWYPTPNTIFRVEESYLPWRRKPQLPLKCCPSIKLHHMRSQKAKILTLNTMRASNLTQQNTGTCRSSLLSIIKITLRFCCLVLSICRTLINTGRPPFSGFTCLYHCKMSVDMKVLYLSQKGCNISAPKFHGMVFTFYSFTYVCLFWYYLPS